MIPVYRDYSEPDRTEVVWSSESVTNGCPAASFSHTQLLSRRIGYYSGEKHENYRARVRRGDLIPFTYYRRFDLTASQSGRRSLTWKPYYCSATGGNTIRTAKIHSIRLFEDFSLFETETSLTAKYIVPLGDGRDLIQAAMAKAYGSFDLGTFLGELGKTISMIVSLKRRAVELLTRKPSIKDPANMWLEWNYGWKILYRECLSIEEALRDGIVPVVHRFHDFEGSEISNTREITSGKFANGEQHIVRVVDTGNVGVLGAYAAKFGGNHPKPGFLNAAITAWELIPYSFVLDWFVNIGGWIKSLLTSFWALSETSSVGYELVFKREISLIGTQFDGVALTAYSASGSARLSANLRLRFPRKATLSPTINLKFESVDHLLTGVALIIQRLR